MIWYIAYAIPALIVGYIFARQCFTGSWDTKPRTATQVKTGNLWGALLIGLTWGLLWPLVVVVYLFALAMDLSEERNLNIGRRIGERIFGKVQR